MTISHTPEHFLLGLLTIPISIALTGKPWMAVGFWLGIEAIQLYDYGLHLFPDTLVDLGASTAGGLLISIPL